MQGLSAGELRTAVLLTAAVFATTLVVRLVFLVVSAYLIRALDRRPQQRALRTTNRARVVSMLSGFRGAVSLAVAMSVPMSLREGDAGARDIIVFVTAGVVVATIVLQGLSLPAAVRWAAIPPDDTAEREEELAWRTAREDAAAAAPELATHLGVDPAIAKELQAEYAGRLADADDEQRAQRERQERDLRLALLDRKRGTIIRLRDEGTIDDAVLRRIQGRLDLEEVRLTGLADIE